MRIGVLGTGIVGRTLAGALQERGHDTTMGTRDVEGLMARSEPDAMGNPPFAGWHAGHAGIGVAPFAEAAAHGELVVNATAGSAAVDALTQARAENLSGKIVIDTSNALDFSQGFPPTLFVTNTDSLGERIQQAFPDARIVKALNTVNAGLMVDPGSLADGDHTLLICGNDEGAKSAVTGYLRDWFGWKDILDLGDITNARATEGSLILWTRLFGVLGTAQFSQKIVR